MVSTPPLTCWQNSDSSVSSHSAFLSTPSVKLRYIPGNGKRYNCAILDLDQIVCTKVYVGKYIHTLGAKGGNSNILQDSVTENRFPNYTSSTCTQ